MGPEEGPLRRLDKMSPTLASVNQLCMQISDYPSTDCSVTPKCVKFVFDQDQAGQVHSAPQTT